MKKVALSWELLRKRDAELAGAGREACPSLPRDENGMKRWTAGQRAMFFEAGLA